MSRIRHGMVMGFCVAASLGAVGAVLVHGAGPAAAPVAAPRPAAAIETDLTAAKQALDQLVPYPQALGEAKFRKESGEKVIPVLRKMADLWGEAAAENVPMAARNRLQCLSMAVAMGDKDSAKALADMAAGKGAEEALDLKSWLVLGNWVNASEDAPAQQKVLEEVAAIAKESAKAYAELTAERDAFNASNAGKPMDADTQKKVAERDAAIAKAGDRQDILANVLIMMSQMGAANEDMSKRALAVIKTTLNSDGAKQAAARAETDQTQKNLIGRPLRIRGRTTANAQFNLLDLRGKVVLVDFWATWCPPCRDSVPALKKLYADFHDKGLEIVGVDSDVSDGVVANYTKENAMPWMQLREETQTDDDNEHPLLKRFGIEGIPTFFLVDRRGVLRYIDGEVDTVNKIKKLLDEVDSEPPAVPPPPIPKK